MGSRKRQRVRNAKEPTLRFIRVTTTALYCFEDHSINGWEPQQIIEDWFDNYPMDRHHASREAHQLGGSTIVKTAKPVTRKQAEQHLSEVKEFHKKLQEKKRKRDERWTKCW